MALLAMESVRDAELQAQKNIELAQADSELSVAQARQRASQIVADAKDKAQSMIDGSARRASKSAEEIIVTARNSAVLDAEKLRRSCAQRQQDVNARILQLMTQ